MGIFDIFKSKPAVHPTRVRTVAEFDALVLESQEPVIVDVWSASCAPCRMLEPILVDIATRYAGRVRVVEIATQDTESQLLGELEVRATPTLIMFKNGEEIGRAAGARPASWFDQMIAKEFGV